MQVLGRRKGTGEKLTTFLISEDLKTRAAAASALDHHRCARWRCGRVFDEWQETDRVGGLVGCQSNAGNLGGGGHQILKTDQGVGCTPWLYDARPLGSEGHTCSTFKDGELVASPRAVWAMTVFLHLLHLVGGRLPQPARVVTGTVIRRGNHQSVFSEPVFLQRLHHAANAGVGIHHKVAIEADAAFAFELL